LINLDVSEAIRAAFSGLEYSLIALASQRKQNPQHSVSGGTAVQKWQINS
jgi:hypothetical protein